jgi:hypothetical protein
MRGSRTPWRRRRERIPSIRWDLLSAPGRIVAGGRRAECRRHALPPARLAAPLRSGAREGRGRVGEAHPGGSST